jgi:predicted GNAT family N-acyltransferase
MKLMDELHSSYQIKKLLFSDIEQAIKLSNAENWNQTEKDWDLLIRNPQNICLSVLDEEKIIGTATAINYNNEIAWIGMVLVDREYRGKGISKMLLSVLLEKLKSCKSVKLDATPAGQPVYKKYGFKDEYLIHRMIAPDIRMKQQAEQLPLKQIFASDIDAVVEFDMKIFGADRKQLIHYLVNNFSNNCWMLISNGQITGIALGRKGARFYQIGPVMALNPENAKILILKSLEKLIGKPVVIDIPDDKKELAEWLESIGFSSQRNFFRMYRNEKPFPGIPEYQFLICGPEFG